MRSAIRLTRTLCNASNISYHAGMFYMHACCLIGDPSERTGWLKLKYPTGQNAISRQSCEILYPIFLVYVVEILLPF